MKVLSIGREETCDIVIDDPESLISRKHALLKIYFTGKMELVDMSANGTYVNGRAITKNVPFPVTRKDVVSFARTKKLDWKQVPNYGLYLRIGLLALVVIALLLIAMALLPKSIGEKAPSPNTQPQTTMPSSANDNEAKTEADKGQAEESASATEAPDPTPQQVRDAFRKKESPKKQDKKESETKKENNDKEEKPEADQKDKSDGAGAKDGIL